MTTEFPALSLIIFVPIVAAVIILFLKREQADLIRGIAIGAAAVCFALSLFVYLNYNRDVDTLTANLDAAVESGVNVGTTMFSEALRFEEYVPWLPELGIGYHLGVDGLSAPMVLLTGMVAVAGVLISWRIEDRTREFMAFFMLLVAGVYGVFVAIDMFTLFFFYELAIFPMYLLIATWGWVETREYAAMKLTLYILVGSVVALIGVIAMVIYAHQFFNTPEGLQIVQNAVDSGILSSSAFAADGSVKLSFDIVNLTLAAENGAFDIAGYGGIEVLSFAKLWFPFIFIGFAVLAGV